MTEDEKYYGMSILTKRINTYLDKNVPTTEEGLNLLVAKCDEMVWNIATNIYTQSGHKVDFSIVRDVINSRIDFLKTYVETEKVAAYKRLQIQQAKETIRAAEEKKELDALAKKLEESGRDKSMSYLFLKLGKIISDMLDVDLDSLTLDSHISNDLGADYLDIVELSWELTKEFDIEIPESLLSSELHSCDSSGYYKCEFASCTIGELLDFLYKSLPLN